MGGVCLYLPFHDEIAILLWGHYPNLLLYTDAATALEQQWKLWVKATGGITEQGPGKSLGIRELINHGDCHSIHGSSGGHELWSLELCQKHQQDLWIEWVGSSWFFDMVEKLDGTLSSKTGSLGWPELFGFWSDEDCAIIGTHCSHCCWAGTPPQLLVSLPP